MLHLSVAVNVRGGGGGRIMKLYMDEKKNLIEAGLSRHRISRMHCLL